MSILISMEKENLKRIREEDVPTTTAETSKDIRSDTVSSNGEPKHWDLLIWERIMKGVGVYLDWPYRGR